MLPLLTILSNATQGNVPLQNFWNINLTESIIATCTVIAPNKDYKYGRQGKEANRFLLIVRISNVVRNTFRPRFKWRPYVLRSYFDTQLLVAESRGKIAHDLRVFFMGHKGSIEARYTTNKGILSEDLVKEMREAFTRSEELLDLESPPKVPSSEQKDLSVIASAGQMQERSEDQEQFTSQKVVSSKVAEKLIAEGWKFVAVLPNSKVILEKIQMPIK